MFLKGYTKERMKNNPYHKIYIDYPKTERGKKLSDVFAFVTYISIFVVTLSSYIKIGDPYFDYVIMVEIIFSFFFLVDFLIRWYLSKFSWRFLCNFYSILDIISILPFFIISFMSSTNFVDILIMFRMWRLLRLFRLEHNHYFIKKIWRAVQQNKNRFTLWWLVFLIVWLFWSFIMYWLESKQNVVFETIPHAMRWMATKLFMVWYTSWDPTTPIGVFIGSLLLFIWPVFISILTWTIIVTFLDVLNIVEEKNEDYVCEHCLTVCNRETDLYCRVCWKKLP